LVSSLTLVHSATDSLISLYRPFSIWLPLSPTLDVTYRPFSIWLPLSPTLDVTADLLNIFETFLPQLLLYPNPTDPLNGEAAALLMREPEAYSTKVKGWLKDLLTH